MYNEREWLRVWRLITPASAKEEKEEISPPTPVQTRSLHMPDSRWCWTEWSACPPAPLPRKTPQSCVSHDCRGKNITDDPSTQSKQWHTDGQRLTIVWSRGSSAPSAASRSSSAGGSCSFRENTHIQLNKHIRCKPDNHHYHPNQF